MSNIKFRFEKPNNLTNCFISIKMSTFRRSIIHGSVPLFMTWIFQGMPVCVGAQFPEDNCWIKKCTVALGKSLTIGPLRKS